MKKLIIIVFIALLSVFMVVADGVDDRGQPNDPDTNDRANACYEGGSMEHAGCSTEWEWVCGWHLIRWEADGSYDMPVTCRILLPPELETSQTVLSCIPADSHFSSDEIEDTGVITTSPLPPFPTDLCGNSMALIINFVGNVYATGFDFYCDTGGSPYELRFIWTGVEGSYTEYYTGNCLT